MIRCITSNPRFYPVVFPKLSCSFRDYLNFNMRTTTLKMSGGIYTCKPSTPQIPAAPEGLGVSLGSLNRLPPLNIFCMCMAWRYSWLRCFRTCLEITRSRAQLSPNGNSRAKRQFRSAMPSKAKARRGNWRCPTI